MHNKFSKKVLITALSVAFSGLLTGCQTTSSLSSDNTATASVQAASSDSRHEYMLDNGLKVIIKEDHRAPVVTSQVWYRIGSTDEPLDKGGISHLLEHLMFEGTEKVAGSDFDAVVEKFGGKLNAFTNLDYTGYYETLPSNRLGLALELESDRMTNLLFDEEKFKKEHQVVMEERRQRIDDNPLGAAYEGFQRQILPDSPRGESVIGPMPELESITLDDLKGWYKKWYSPNNAVLIIVGDVDPDDAIKQVKHYFGDIKPSELTPRPSVSQQAFRGYNRTVVKAPISVPVLMMGYTLPTLNSVTKNPTAAESEQTVHALSLLISILDNGRSDRLESRLVRGDELLANIYSEYDPFARGNTWLWLETSPREGVSLETAEKAIYDEIERLKTGPITQQEIQRAKTNVITGLVYEQDSISGQAWTIGTLQSSGLDDRLLEDLPAKLDRISPEMLQQVARTYLSKDNLEVMQVIPEDAK